MKEKWRPATGLQGKEQLPQDKRAMHPGNHADQALLPHPAYQGERAVNLRPAGRSHRPRCLEVSRPAFHTGCGPELRSQGGAFPYLQTSAHLKEGGVQTLPASVLLVIFLSSATKARGRACCSEDILVATHLRRPS